MAKLILMKGRWREGHGVSYNMDILQPRPLMTCQALGMKDLKLSDQSLPYMNMIMNLPVRLGQAMVHARAAVVYGHVTLK
jgi:hypothetical protein